MSRRIKFANLTAVGCKRLLIAAVVWITLKIYIWTTISTISSISENDRPDFVLGNTSKKKSLQNPPSRKIHPTPKISETGLNKTNERDIHIPTGSKHEVAILNVAYNQKWVGFPDLDGRHCRQALYSNVSNDMFKKRVKRVKGYLYTDDKTHCLKFRHLYGYNRYPPASEEEREFPLAFIILFHNNFDQVMFLLRAIYHPHNVYCLSIDDNNNSNFIATVRNIMQCLPNVFVASKLEKIVYAGFSRLMADIHCMDDLLKHPVNWKYVINLPGQQFPLRTNLELVKILTMLNGTNDIEGMPDKSSIPGRFIFKHITSVNTQTGKTRMIATKQKNPPPPHNLTIIKGSTYGTFSKAFVQFSLHHPTAKAFLEYCRYILSPDEYFWSTLQHTSVVIVPGRYTGSPSPHRYLSSYSVWSESNTTSTTKCATKYVHRICIFTPEDLRNLIQQRSLFANKFHIYFHPAALHCLDQWLFNATVAGTVRDLSAVADSLNLNNNDT